MRTPHAFVIGTPSLKSEFERAGFTLVGCEDEALADVVAVGGHNGFDYAELRGATRALRAGARLYGAGRDATFPMADGPWPASGALLAAVEFAGGVQATVVGKPGPYIFEIARSLLPGERVAIVGDNLSSDIVGGRRAGVTTIVVLSGTTSAADLDEAFVEPNYVLDDLAALSRLLQRA